MSILPPFRLSSASRRTAVAPGPNAPPLMLRLRLDLHTPDESEGITSCGNTEDSEFQGTGSSHADTDDSETQITGSSRSDTPDNAESATSRRVGSFNWDRKEGGFSLEWADLGKFELWRQTEERLSCIEFVASTTQTQGILWTRSQRYVCGRQASGGIKFYEKKHPARERKIKSKKSGCRCHVLIKQYPHTSTVLGRYEAEHDHEIGAANIAYTRLSGTTREQIKTMLSQKIDRYEIVRVIRATAPDGSRDQLIALKEVNQMAQVLDNHKIRLHPDDAIATRLLIDQLSTRGNLTFYKNKQDRAPINSRLPEDAFVLCIQTDFQLNAYWELGDGFIGIDATHNITQYQDLLLFTIIARDRWGHGVPVAWMLTSSGTTEIITFFVKWVRDASPSVRPKIIMTDRDQAQIAALESAFPQSRILLCMWHVLRAIRSHFVTSQFQGLWEKIKAWVTTEDIATFYNIWDEISNDPLVPESVVKYLSTEWLPVLHRWSMIGRKHRSIFEEGNTNMLVEAYHHVLKTHCLGGKRNRRVDYIIQALVLDFLPEIQTRLSRQAVKLEGPNLEAARRKQILRIARNISPDSIRQIGDAKFFVASKSRPGHHYMIDLNQLNCDCYDFPRIRHCKHIAAINVHIPGLCPKVDRPSEIPERARVPVLPKHTPRPEESARILKDINALCQQLNAVSDRSTPDLKALKSVKFSLTQAIALANGSRALPEKDVFHPNKNTWAETAKRMGAKPPKRKPGPTGGNTSTECIGPVKGKRARKYSDPYAAGERSGKRAKPDAVSVAANERSCAVVPAPPPFTRVDSPARASPSAAVAGTAARSFTRADQSTPGPLAHPPSSAAPGLAFSPLSVAPPGHASAARAFPSAAVAGSAALSFSRADQSTADPLAHPPSGAAPELAFSPLSAAPPGYAFARPSAAVPRFAYAVPSAQTGFRAEIMRGNAFAHTHSPPEPHST